MSEASPHAGPQFAILTDTTRCTSCEACVQACKDEYDLPQHDTHYRWKQNIDDLSSTRFTTILHKPGDKYIRHQCRHCNDPACVSACIVAALRKEPDTGAVTYDENRCMGCRYCMMACPYGIPRYSWEDQVPIVRKCILCHHRVQEGKQPRCTEACPYNATVFGTREEMIAEAKRRIAASPGKYFTKPGKSEPEIWGEHEIGGVSVLYISDISLDFLGWRPNLGTEPLPALTWEALSKVPPIVLAVAGSMGAAYWFFGRRARVAAERAAELEAQRAAEATVEEPEGHA